jgi:hypothetical protein
VSDKLSGIEIKELNFVKVSTADSDNRLLGVRPQLDGRGRTGTGVGLQQAAGAEFDAVD